MALGDLADPAVAETLVAQAVARFGGLDVLVSNAGFADRTAFAELTDAAMTASVEAIQGAFFRLARAARAASEGGTRCARGGGVQLRRPRVPHRHAGVRRVRRGEGGAGGAGARAGDRTGAVRRDGERGGAWFHPQGSLARMPRSIRNGCAGSSPACRSAAWDCRTRWRRRSRSLPHRQRATSPARRCMSMAGWSSDAGADAASSWVMGFACAQPILRHRGSNASVMGPWDGLSASETHHHCNPQRLPFSPPAPCARQRHRSPGATGARTRHRAAVATAWPASSDAGCRIVRRGQQQDHQIHRLLIDRGEIDRPCKSNEQHEASRQSRPAAHAAARTPCPVRWTPGSRAPATPRRSTGYPARAPSPPARQLLQQLRLVGQHASRR